MTSNINLQNLNTNIDDYSIEELYNLLELEEFTREHIILTVNDLTTNVFSNNASIKEFFLNAQTKLLDYLTNYDGSIDSLLHNNANSNIETNSNTNKEGFVGLNQEQDYDEEPEPEQQQETTNSLSDFVITNILRKKKFHFNTAQKTYSNEDPVNCRMYVQRTINVKSARLMSITCKRPLLIHSSKVNNFFTIQKYVGEFCDFSAQIIIDDGYYEDIKTMSNTININIQKKALDLSVNSQDFLNANFLNNIIFSFNYINIGIFKLTSAFLISSSISYYALDFTSTANSQYSLATILGFSTINNSNIFNNSGDILTITGSKPYNTISNKLPFFFCFEDNNNSLTSNYICLKTNFIQARVLAKISPITCFRISNTLSTNFDDTNANVLVYNGRVNIENFSVKILDIYGNLLLSINDDFCFELEFECEELTATNGSSIILPNILPNI
jgi:hypothetical protein